MTESRFRSNFQPLHDFVLVVRQKQETVTASGLHIPESAADPRKGTLARVLAAGPGKRHPNTGIRIPMEVRAGDMVVIARHQNTAAEVAVSSLPPELGEAWDVGDGDVLLMLRETDLLAVLAADDETLEEVSGEVTADAGEAFAGSAPKPEIVDLMQALKDSLAAAGNARPMRRDELAEERASRYTREDGSRR